MMKARFANAVAHCPCCKRTILIRVSIPADDVLCISLHDDASRFAPVIETELKTVVFEKSTLIPDKKESDS